MYGPRVDWLFWQSEVYRRKDNMLAVYNYTFPVVSVTSIFHVYRIYLTKTYILLRVCWIQGTILERLLDIVKCRHVMLLVVVVSCHVDKQTIWRTTAKEEDTSILQNAQNTQFYFYTQIHFVQIHARFHKYFDLFTKYHKKHTAYVTKQFCRKLSSDNAENMVVRIDNQQ